ncbi:MAG: type II toxin-antitoxin system RelE/ParE family toxin [Nanoarchaeota archaeon]
MYDFNFSIKFEKQFDKLDILTQKRIINSLERIRIRPYYFVKKIVGTKFFRLRVGDYRIILKILNNSNIY